MSSGSGLGSALNDLYSFYFFRDTEKNIPSRILSSGHIDLLLNRKILVLMLLVLRFYSIEPGQSDPNPSAILG